METLRWCMLFTMTAVLSIFDIILGQIPVRGVLVCAAAGVCMNIYGGFNAVQLAASIIPAAVLLITGKLFKGIGSGDVILFMAIGGICGCIMGMTLLMYASVFCAVYCLIKKKREIPFIPFILAAEYFYFVAERLTG